MFELCIIFYKYPRNDARYYVYSTFESMKKELEKWLNDGTIKEENIYNIRYIKES